MANRNAAKKRKREMFKPAFGGQPYMAAGIPCGVDNMTGRIVAQALGMKLVTVDDATPRPFLEDTYYVEPKQSPYAQTR